MNYVHEYCFAVGDPRTEITVESIRERIAGSFPADMGVEALEIDDELCRGRMVVDRRHLHPGGLVHGGGVAREPVLLEADRPL